ncbi:MAG: hypothetical protein SFU98_03045 [Leptospiraceae bacterium]|nr:hypothetical protein [Leptospiraceae bacterium]
MHVNAREFDSEIFIDEKDKWIFRGNEITLKEVLDHFKQNLFEDEKGVYIYNTMGNLAEKGYVNLLGFPLHIFNFEQKGNQSFFYTDSKEILDVKDLIFYINSEERIYCKKYNDSKIKYSLTKSVLGVLTMKLVEIDNAYFFEFNSIRQVLHFD